MDSGRSKLDAVDIEFFVQRQLSIIKLLL